MKDVRIFLSSPGDCSEERNAVHALAERLNKDPVVATFARISVVAWDWGAGVPLDALNTPQTSVNRWMPVPEACEIFIGVFRCRFGTPLPSIEFRRPDGSTYLSGSEYEFHRAWDARRRGLPFPTILMYRWQPQIGSSCSPGEQLEHLERFFSEPPFKEKDVWIGSHERFADIQDFSSKLEGRIRIIVSEHSPGSRRDLGEWLHERAEILSVDAGPRYTANAHVSTDIGKVFDWLLMRRPAIESLDNALGSVHKALRTIPAFDKTKKELESFAASIRADSAWWRSATFNSLIAALKEGQAIAWAEIEQIENAEEADKSEADAKVRESRQRNKQQLREIASCARDAFELLRKFGPLVTKRVLMITGGPGQGKTHTMIREVCETVQAEGVAFGILGQTLSSTGPLWESIRIRAQWDGSIDELLDALENRAAVKGQRALIVVDALNETPQRTRWHSELLGMIHQVLQRPNLTLAISVRSDYFRQVVPNVADEMAPWVRWAHPGFAGIEPEALAKYFAHFGVKALAAPPLGEFNNPLYVQLLAKSLVGKELPHMQPSWLQVWDAWIERLELDATERLGLDDPSRRRPLRRVMHNLAQAMLESGQFALRRVVADTIARDVTGVDGVIGFLCSSGAIVDRIDETDDELIEFGFERLSDTFIADCLLKRLFNGIESKEDRKEALRAALHPGGSLAVLSDENWSDHPLRRRRAGLLEAICLASPALTGYELPDHLPNRDDEGIDWELSQAFIDSFRWRSGATDFGGPDEEKVKDLWFEHARNIGDDSLVDELIRLALVPGHPLGMKALLHPALLKKPTLGDRDEMWSIKLPSLWSSDNSNLRQLVDWACEADLFGVHPDTALPAAQLLAWICSTSQNGLRESAMRGLTRILFACPVVLPNFLPDFLSVNDPYVLEAVLIAIWGVTLEAPISDEITTAVNQIYASEFGAGEARHCHLTIRHYARRIVEAAHARGIFSSGDLRKAIPPFSSQLPLADVPDIKTLESLSESKGFGAIVHSCTQWDFYRYVMGGNSASLDVSSKPLAHSSQPRRPFVKSESYISGHAREDMFDLALAGRFVAWNALSLGYSGEKFDEFDTGYQTREYGRSDGDGRTERIGKKYQWIGWYSLLAFLADNYELRPGWDKVTRAYDNPDQLGITLYDPARWLHGAIKENALDVSAWNLHTVPPWPLPELDEMQAWLSSSSADLSPLDVISIAPELPEKWGQERWIRLAAEHSWESNYAPGYWAKRRKFRADIWWQITPVLIQATHLPLLLEKLGEISAKEEISGLGRLDINSEWNTPLSSWSELAPEWDSGMKDGASGVINGWLPVPYRPLIASCGHPDRRDEHAPIFVPTPSICREWNLALRLRDGLMLSNEEPVFGLASAVNARGVLFARVEPLMRLLATGGHSLVWFFRGERHAFQNIENPDEKTSVWADYHGIGYLTADGRPQVAWMSKRIRNGDSRHDSDDVGLDGILNADSSTPEVIQEKSKGIWNVLVGTANAITGRLARMFHS